MPLACDKATNAPCGDGTVAPGTNGHRPEHADQRHRRRRPTAPGDGTHDDRRHPAGRHGGSARWKHAGDRPATARRPPPTARSRRPPPRRPRRSWRRQSSDNTIWGWSAVLAAARHRAAPRPLRRVGAPAEGRPMTRASPRPWALRRGPAPSPARRWSRCCPSRRPRRAPGCTESYGGHGHGRPLVGDRAVARARSSTPAARPAPATVSSAVGRQAHRHAGPRAGHGEVVGRARHRRSLAQPVRRERAAPGVPGRADGVPRRRPEELRERHRAVGPRSGHAEDLLDQHLLPAHQLRQSGRGDLGAGRRRRRQHRAPAGHRRRRRPGQLQRQRQLRLLDHAVQGDQRNALRRRARPSRCRPRPR